MTLRRAWQKHGVVLLTRSKEAAEADDECPSVSLDLSCDSSSFDSDDCATRAEKVSDLVLPHILGVSPCNYDKDRRSNTHLKNNKPKSEPSSYRPISLT